MFCYLNSKYHFYIILMCKLKLYNAAQKIDRALKVIAFRKNIISLMDWLILTACQTVYGYFIPGG